MSVLYVLLYSEWLKKINAAKGIFAPDDETDPGEKDQIFHGGWLNKCG